MEYEAVIGLETHIQLNSQTKIFCSCRADSWFDQPNTNICPVCCGMPGVLPVLNKRAVEKGVLLAKAMNSDIQKVSYFDRKNYFYPDLPKGYQITQYDRSLAKGGFLDVPQADGTVRRVNIWKLHLEEDAGKTKNEAGRRLIDFNRCGVPLVEMVTGPDLRSADEAANYLTRLRQLLRWLGVSEADMEKGHLRCDANVSIRKKGETILNTKTEIKNVNSIEAVRTAIAKEIARQIRETEAGNKIESWTLEWDEDSQTLKKMRSKETEADYRYFREPDLLPVFMDEKWQKEILADFPELPLARRTRFMQEFGLPEYDAEILTGDRAISEYFMACLNYYQGDPKKVSNWLINDVLRMLNDSGQSAADLHLSPQYLADIIKMVEENTINSTTGKALLDKVNNSNQSPVEIVQSDGLAKISDDTLIRKIVEEVLVEFPKEVSAYKAGKLGLIGFFVGQVMKKMQGKGDAQVAKALLDELLK